MTYLLMQTFMLLLASYFLGAFVACALKRIISPHQFAASSVGAPVVQERAVAVPAPVAAPVVHVPVQPPVAAPAPSRVQPLPVPTPRPTSVPQIATPQRTEPVRPSVSVAQRPSRPPDPTIETGMRPEPRIIRAIVDAARFERALFGPDPNEGMPRVAIVEIRPAILTSPTGPAHPWPPKPKPIEIVETEVKPEPIAASAWQVKDERGQAKSSVPAAGDSKSSPVPTADAMSATVSAAAAAMAAARAAAAAAAAIVMPQRTQPAQRTTAESDKAETAKAKAAGAKTPPSGEPSSAAAAQSAASSAQPAVQAPARPRVAGDDLQRIRAIDAETERRLNDLGVMMFDHIADWTVADVRRVSQTLGFTDRIDREQWVEQAQILAKGGETYYSRNRAAALNAQAKSEPKGPTGVSAASASAPAKPAPEKSATSSVHVEAPVSPPSAEAAPKPAPSIVGERKSVTEMAAAAAAAIAAASASVTRGIRPIEPLSPLSKVDPNIPIPARLSDAIKGKEAQTAAHKPAVPISSPSAPSAGTGENDADDLKRIRGIGVLIEKRLNAMGVTRYEHIAHWNSGDIDRLSQMLDFKGRIERENWVEQARILASGGQTEFSRRVDRGDVDTSRDA